MIEPTVGRVVHYYPGEFEPYQGQGPLCALICHVWSDTCVNLCVFNPDGFPESRTSVLLVQPEMTRADGGAGHCEWMPYKESGEQAVGTQQI